MTDVKKPLISAQEMVSKGSHVIFEADGPTIRNRKTGIELPMIQRGAIPDRARDCSSEQL